MLKKTEFDNKNSSGLVYIQKNSVPTITFTGMKEHPKIQYPDIKTKQYYN